LWRRDKARKRAPVSVCVGDAFSRCRKGRAGHVRPALVRGGLLRGFLCGYFVGGGGVDIKGANLGCSFEQVLHGLLHRVELLALVALGILARIPEAQREDAIRLRVRDEPVDLIPLSLCPPTAAFWSSFFWKELFLRCTA
jgi:hypothetical protein